MNLVDANVILRYILDDHPELSTAAAAILEQDAAMTEQNHKLGKTLWAIAETIALLKLHKKGLIQQLFPSLEESIS